MQANTGAVPQDINTQKAIRKYIYPRKLYHDMSVWNSKHALAMLLIFLIA